MKRLYIDISHILKAVCHSIKSGTSVEFEGKVHNIPDPRESFDRFMMSYSKTLGDLEMTPVQTVLVKDGMNCKAMRRQFLEGYCVRPKGPKEWMDSFKSSLEMVEETILKYGGISVDKDGFEADDLIAALNEKSPGITWSGDKDILAAGDVYYKGEINPDKFMGIAKRHIVLYKSLVGDTSDKIPGCPGFGEAKWIDMLAEFGDEALDYLLEMFETETLHELEEDVEDFKPFKKVIDNLDTVYASYDCAKFYHPGWELNWKMAYPEGNGELPKWEPTSELITKDKLTKEFLDNLLDELHTSPFNSFDIEGSQSEESIAWCELNKNKQGKKPFDTLGFSLAGFSITTGENCHKTYYFPVDHADTDNISMEDAEKILNMLPDQKPYEGDDRSPLIVQNTGFEIPSIRSQFELKFDRGYLPQLMYDTKIMAGYVDEYDHAGLKHNSKKYMGYDQIKYEDVVGTTTDEEGNEVLKKMRDLTGEQVLRYGCDDTICTGALYSLYRLIMDYEESWDCYYQVDLAAQFIYSERFLNGIKFDQDKIKELQVENHKRYKELYSRIQDFLINLEWTELKEVTEKKEKASSGRITLADLKKIKAGEMEMPTAEEDDDFEEVTMKWPGTYFSPLEDMAPANLKKAFNDTFQKEVKTNVRRLDKLAKIFTDEGQPEFGQAVVDSDLNRINQILEDNFKPNPELNLRSPKQVTTLLYDCLKLPVRVRGKVSDKMRQEGKKEGNPAGNESAFKHAIVYDLQDNEEITELIKTLIEAKSCLTEDSLFLTPYQKLPHHTDGFVHPQFAISDQKSGRGTAKQPNDAQVAKDGGVREVYIPYDEDYVWVSMDFESQELVHVAVQSGDENMLGCFRGERRDIHSIMGSRIAGLKDPDMTYEKFVAERKGSKELTGIRNKKAKPTNFLKVYGGTAHSLAIKMLCSEDEAKTLLSIYDDEFPDVSKWQDRMTKLNLDRGYAVTPMGRRRHVSKVKGADWMLEHEARAGINHEIQGGSAEQVKLVLRELWEQKIFEEFDAFFMGTVHDEINNIVRRDQVLDFIKAVHPIMMRNFCDFPVEFRSSIEIGPNFGQLTEIGTEIDEEAILEAVEACYDDPDYPEDIPF